MSVWKMEGLNNCALVKMSFTEKFLLSPSRSLSHSHSTSEHVHKYLSLLYVSCSSWNIRKMCYTYILSHPLPFNTFCALFFFILHIQLPHTTQSALSWFTDDAIRIWKINRNGIKIYYTHWNSLTCLLWFTCWWKKNSLFYF